MIDTIKRAGTIVEFTRAEDGTRKAIIAVNDDVGDGRPIPLRAMQTDDYMRNPVILYNHDRWSQVPIGQTKKLEWEARGLAAYFEFLPGDEFAQKVQNAWDRGFLRAASITASRDQEAPPGQTDQFRLVEWSIVPVPADVDAVRSLGGLFLPGHQQTAPPPPPPTEPSDMTEQEVAAIVKRALDERDAESQRDAQLKEIVTETLRELGIAPQAADGDDGEPAQRGQQAAAPSEPAQPAATDLTPEQQIEQGVKERTAVLDLTRGLLPEGFETEGKTNKDIMVAACGNEVEDAASRSEDYLRAKLEGIKERRDQAAGGLSRAPSNGNGAPQTGFGMRAMTAVDIQRMKRERTQKAVA